MTGSDLREDVRELAQEAPAGAVRAPARLLEYAPGCFVAFAPHATVVLVDSPPLVHVPGAPCHALGLMRWQERQVPLIDLDALLRPGAGAPAPSAAHVLVLAYQPAPNAALEYGAVRAPSLVQTVQVADDDACELPQGSELWPRLAIACFEHDGRPVPVIDTARLFGEPLA